MENQKYSIMYIGKEECIDIELTEKITDSGMEWFFCDISNVDNTIDKYLANQADLVIINDDGYKPGFIDALKMYIRVPGSKVIVISDKADVFTEVFALEIGADDYLIRPVEAERVVARIRNVLKRNSAHNDINGEEIRYPGLVVNISQYRVEIYGKQIKMPPKELELLYLLASNPNIVYTRQRLLEIIWGYDMDVGSRTVDVHVKRLRDKIAKESNLWRIGTVWRVGYRFEVDIPAV